MHLYSFADRKSTTQKIARSSKSYRQNPPRPLPCLPCAFQDRCWRRSVWQAMRCTWSLPSCTQNSPAWQCSWSIYKSSICHVTPANVGPSSSASSTSRMGSKAAGTGSIPKQSCKLILPISWQTGIEWKHHRFGVSKNRKKSWRVCCAKSIFAMWHHVHLEHEIVWGRIPAQIPSRKKKLVFRSVSPAWIFQLARQPENSSSTAPPELSESPGAATGGHAKHFNGQFSRFNSTTNSSSRTPFPQPSHVPPWWPSLSATVAHPAKLT